MARQWTGFFGDATSLVELLWSSFFRKAKTNFKTFVENNFNDYCQFYNIFYIKFIMVFGMASILLFSSWHLLPSLFVLIVVLLMGAHCYELVDVSTIISSLLFIEKHSLYNSISFIFEPLIISFLQIEQHHQALEIVHHHFHSHLMKMLIHPFFDFLLHFQLARWGFFVDFNFSICELFSYIVGIVTYLFNYHYIQMNLASNSPSLLILVPSSLRNLPVRHQEIS